MASFNFWYVKFGVVLSVHCLEIRFTLLYTITICKMTSTWLKKTQYFSFNLGSVPEFNWKKNLKRFFCSWIILIYWNLTYRMNCVFNCFYSCLLSEFDDKNECCFIIFTQVFGLYEFHKKNMKFWSYSSVLKRIYGICDVINLDLMKNVFAALWFLLINLVHVIFLFDPFWPEHVP